MKENKLDIEFKSTSIGDPDGYRDREASEETFKILVIQQKMIGDVLTSSIICENLKRNFPNAEVHYLIDRFTLPVVKENPFIDEFILFEEAYKRSKIEFYKFLKQISKSNYTHVFDAYTKLESLLISKFSKAKFKYGFEKSYSKFYYTKTVKMTNNVKTEAGSAIENRLNLLHLMSGIKTYNNKPKIYLTKKENNDALEKFKSLKINPKQCIMISAVGSGLKKSYPFNYLAEILDLIVDKTKNNLILNYMPSQQKYIDEILNYCNQATKNRIVDHMEMKGLRDFISVCSQCRAIIGNEGGAINMAKALEIPSFAIFSPWVTKVGWNSFEKSSTNDSVHLIDYYPELYSKHAKKYKSKANELYKKLKPKLFLDKLTNFLNKI